MITSDMQLMVEDGENTGSNNKNNGNNSTTDGNVPLVLCKMLQRDFNHPPFLTLTPAFRAAFCEQLTSGIYPIHTIVQNWSLPPTH